jgi:AMP-binding enzyme C-terminal domain
MIARNYGECKEHTQSFDRAPCIPVFWHRTGSNPVNGLALLAEHPEIRQCAVYAAELPDRRMTLRAMVVTNGGAPDEAVTTRRLQDYAKEKLLPYKYPREVSSWRSCRRRGPGRSTARRCCGCNLAS